MGARTEILPIINRPSNTDVKLKIQIGDKVMCIDNKGCSNYISIHKILTVKNIDRFYIEFEEIDDIHPHIRFLSIKDYRKLKLQKLYESRR